MKFDRLEHGVYNLARVRDAATSRYTRFQIPWEWMKQDAGIVSQVEYVTSLHSFIRRGTVSVRGIHVEDCRLYFFRRVREFHAWIHGEDKPPFFMPSVSVRTCTYVCRGVTYAQPYKLEEDYNPRPPARPRVIRHSSA